MVQGRKQKLFKDIIKRIPEETIFKHFIKNYKVGEAILSPLRCNDKKPSFVIYKNENKLRWYDFGIGKGGDVIEFIKKKFNCNFIKALDIINNDFNIENLTDNHIQAELPGNTKIIKKNITKIIPKRSYWNIKDKEFWTQYGIGSKILKKFNVFPTREITIIKNDNEKCINFNRNVYCYYLGLNEVNRYKIYNPYDEKFRWFGNTTKDIIQGINQLEYKNKELIITKSLKDVMVLYIMGYDSIAPASESIHDMKIINNLKDKYEKIFTLMDFDYAGIICSNKLKKKYNTIPIFLTNGRFDTIDYGAKDISDYVKTNGIEKGKEVITKLMKIYD